MTNRPPASHQRPESISKPGSKNQYIIYSLIFIIGFISGVAFSVYKGNLPGPGQTAPGSGEAQGQAPGQTAEMRQAILTLEAEVTKNPQNYQAWTHLGNLYYDADQPEKAIAAYSKSLELHQGDANILTDLGVMYRQARQPKKAVEQFDRAMREDPTHLPSRYNKGIVLLYDLQDPQGAIASWQEMLAIDPKAKAGTGESIRDLIDRVKKEQTVK
jgi:cytochrome c-type biogenesis protein CcmH/NrfG